jgi:hypothetical protein
MNFKKETKQGKCNHANVKRDGGNVERNHAIVN